MTPRVASDSLKLMYTQSLSPRDIAVPGCHGNSIEGGYKVDQLHVQCMYQLLIECHVISSFPQLSGVVPAWIVPQQQPEDATSDLEARLDYVRLRVQKQSQSYSLNSKAL